ncbi:UvrD-helicase domain-containing protein [Chitinivorax sp. B]|uniref:UvrD-helicase domain-containing protein n=1 Tax=Chitinivorax sp. B TaxID=2502235 RepID=UPI0010F88CAD|nr:UvrD-helicase domain-containing protein [Chitinivorax sp. B]
MPPPSLNPPQREAIHYVDGPLLVLAGAGSGKTRVITHKIAYLINEYGMSARNIAAITFTNKAAREMQERVEGLLHGSAGRGLTVCTFHSLGMQIMRQESKRIGYKPQFSILDANDGYKIVSDILKTTDKEEIRRVQSIISRWKNDFVSPEDALNNGSHEGEFHAARCYRTYQDTLFAYQAMDFDDLIRLPVELFEHDEEALEKWRNKLKYLLIDECQDTNTCQYKLVRQLTGRWGKFTAVGDDDQSIYAWRGANMENLRLLQQDYPNLKLVKLEQNYRSTSRILRAANSVIGNNPKLFEKTLWSNLGEGDPINILAVKDDEHEAETIAMRILAHKFEHGKRFLDYAILYRGNHQARVIEQALRNQRIPYVMSGGQSFFDKAEIKDVIAYLRLLANQDDDPAFIRAATTPKRGIGNITLEKLGTYSAERHISLFAAATAPGMEIHLQEKQLGPLRTFCDFINRMQWRAEREPAGVVLMDILKAIDYEIWLYDSEEGKAGETKWKNVMDFVGWVTKKGEEDGKTLIDLAQTIALITMMESRDQAEIDAVRMTTLHASKGLEYPHVFLVGCEEGILPHRESVDNGMVEEERRLMYVAITRAQWSLTITHAMKRRRAGEWTVCEPSRFLGELPGDDIRWSGKPGEKRELSVEEKKSRSAALLASLRQKNGQGPGV